MSVLEDLWDGKICPYENRVRPGTEVEKEREKLIKQEEALSARLNPEEKALLEALLDREGTLNDLESMDQFITGFRLGATLMVDVLYQPYERQFVPVDEG